MMKERAYFSNQRSICGKWSDINQDAIIWSPIPRALGFIWRSKSMDLRETKNEEKKVNSIAEAAELDCGRSPSPYLHLHSLFWMIPCLSCKRRRRRRSAEARSFPSSDFPKQFCSIDFTFSQLTIKSDHHV